MGICGNVLVVFVLFSTITLPRTHSLNDTVEICQSYCNIERGNASGDAECTVTSHCSGSEVTGAPRSSHGNQVVLDTISLYRSTTGLGYMLGAEGYMINRESGNISPNGLQVAASDLALESVPRGNADKACSAYSIAQHSLSQKVTFHHCIDAVQLNTTWSLTFVSATENVSTIYNIRIPVKPPGIEITDPLRAEDWRTPVAIAADVANSSVWIALQPPPTFLNITELEVMLVLIETNQLYHQQYVNVDTTKLFFYNLPAELNNRVVTYKVMVYPLSPSCSNSRCTPSESPAVNISAWLPVASLATSSSTASNTRSTSAPPPPTSRGTRTSLKTTDAGVLIRPAEDRHRYQQSIKIILGTVFGFLGLSTICAMVIFICRRNRTQQTGNFPMQRFGVGRDSDSSVGLEPPYKQLPLVLLLYSYDCPCHERVVISLANYLRFAANCDVLFDIFDQHLIAEQGVYTWLQDKLQVAQYIIVVCSAGARFKCVRNKKFRMKQDRPIIDYFSWAIDCVGEAIRTGKNAGEDMSKYIVVCFDYAGPSDIPPKLDQSTQYCLMRDLFSLYCHLHGLKPDTSSDTAELSGYTAASYHCADVGRALQESLRDALEYFTANPDWLLATLEPITPLAVSANIPRKKTSSKVRKAHSNDELESRSERPPSLAPETSLLEQRRAKRQKEFELSVAPQSPTPAISPTSGSSPVTSSSSPSSSSPLMPTSTLPALPHQGLSSPSDDDYEQLRRDVDAMCNFDARHQYQPIPRKPTGVSLDLPLRLVGYTPPDDYCSIASLDEDLNRSIASLQRSVSISPEPASPSQPISPPPPNNHEPSHRLPSPSESHLKSPQQPSGVGTTPGKLGTLSNPPSVESSAPDTVVNGFSEHELSAPSSPGSPHVISSKYPLDAGPASPGGSEEPETLKEVAVIPNTAAIDQVELV